MPIFLAAFLGGLASAASSIVGRVLLAMFITYVTYTGIDASFTWLSTQVFSTINTLPPMSIQIIGILRIGQGINIIFSAIASAFVIRGLTGGTITKMRFKP